MGCGASASSTANVVLYDPSKFFVGSWFDWNGYKAGTAHYDKVIVKLELPADSKEVPSVKVEFDLDGGCDQSSWHQFGKSGVSEGSKSCCLIHNRSKGCKLVVFTNGSSKIEVPIPKPEDGYVQTTQDGLSVLIRSELSQTKLVSEAALQELPMRIEKFDVKDSTGQGDKRWTRVSIQKTPRNSRAIIWLPGRNDYFAHPHAAKHFLDEGYDVFVCEHRRLGRSLEDSTGDDMMLVSHVDDFSRYLQEFDETFSYVLGGSHGASYDRVVLYAHSTGCLEAVMYLQNGKHKSKIDALLFNSPFLDWGEGGVVETFLDSLDEVKRFFDSLGLKFDSTTALSGGQFDTPSKYAMPLLLQYDSMIPTFRNFHNAKVTAGWAAAASDMHGRVASMIKVSIPVFLTYSDCDDVLDGGEIAEKVNCISTDVTTERFPYCRHDMLLNYDMEDNIKVLHAFTEFLKRKLP